MIDLKLVLEAPMHATGFQFDFDFSRCTPAAPLGCNRTDGQTPDPPYTTSTCAGGTAELEGTGYANTAQPCA